VPGDYSSSYIYNIGKERLFNQFILPVKVVDQSMEMPTIAMWPHTVTMMTPESATNIHMALAAPMPVKPTAGMPNMIRSAGNHVHRATAEISKHDQKRYR
jgi:hypothetical protein